MNFNFLLPALLFVSNVLAFATAPSASKGELIEKILALGECYLSASERLEKESLTSKDVNDLQNTFEDICTSVGDAFFNDRLKDSVAVTDLKLGKAAFGDFNVQRIRHLKDIFYKPELPLTFNDMARYLPESMITADLKEAFENYVIKVRLLKKIFKLSDPEPTSLKEHIFMNRHLGKYTMDEIYSMYTKLPCFTDPDSVLTQEALIQSIRKEIEDEQKAIEIKQQAIEKEKFWSVVFWTLIVVLIVGAGVAGYLFVMKKPTEVSSESTQVKGDAV